MNELQQNLLIVTTELSLLQKQANKAQERVIKKEIQVKLLIEAIEQEHRIKAAGSCTTWECE